VISVILLAAASCSFPSPVTTPEPASLEGTLTILLASTQTAAASAGPSPTAAPSDTPAPSVTPEPSLTPTATYTSTPSVVTLSVSGNTNCRTGPLGIYDLVSILYVGQTAEVVGRDEAGLNWVIQDPDRPGNTCWLWGRYATLVGNWEALPVIAPPPTPTPTPTAAMSVSYVGVATCGGQYGFRFQVSNTGTLPLESVRIVATDNTTATTFTHILDAFRSYGGCSIEDNVASLEPGAAANTANINPGQLSYNPAGHSITAVVTACTSDGLGGTCVSQTLNFTP
jgi:hypothetical protein